MNLFEFQNYKKYVKSYIQSLGKSGHGQLKKIADHLNIGSVNVSQIFNGERHLTIEQACDVAEFFGFTALETKYFVSLVEFERAGSFKLKTLINQRLEELRNQSKDLKSKLTVTTDLTEEMKTFFYSHWYYSGIRLLSSIDGFHSIEAISERLSLPIGKVRATMEFLVSTGLCKEKDGKFQMGPSSTHLGANHPMISLHHVNWRLKAISHFDNLNQKELAVSIPCSLDEESFQKIRQELVMAVERITEHIDKAPCEQLSCLNIDWFRF